MNIKSGKELAKELTEAFDGLDPGAKQHFEGEALAIVVKVFKRHFGSELLEYFDDQLEFLHSVKGFKKFQARAYVLLGIAWHAGEKGGIPNLSDFPRWRKKPNGKG
jgi:hypothetical protein